MRARHGASPWVYKRGDASFSNHSSSAQQRSYMSTDTHMRERRRLFLRIALQQQMNAEAQLAALRLRRARRRRRRPRTKWELDWRTQVDRLIHGPYTNLMVKLRRYDRKGFTNFLRLPPEMFDELLDRVGPALTKRTTNWRTPMEPGMKLALTLQHLAS